MKRIITCVIFLLLFAIMVSAQDVISNTIPASCGNIIESDFENDYEEDNYVLTIEAGTSFEVSLSPFGTGLEATIAILQSNNQGLVMSDGFVQPNGNLDRNRLATSPSAATEDLAASGNYTIRITNFGYWFHNTRTGEYRFENRGGLGLYTIYISCVLRDGTVITPAPPTPIPTPTSSVSTTSEVLPGFGFQGMNPVGFPSDSEIPLQLGQAFPTSVNGDAVALYTYEANADESVTLSISRINGDVSLGVAVIKQETNELIFLGGLPSSNNLSVELTFPSAGTYAIGLFQLRTAERPETSGAVQIMLE